MDFSQGDHGTERELQAREIAAKLSVADFIFTAPHLAKGPALREPSGDGLLIVEDQGAVLQVKARDPSKNDTPERATSWITKKIHEAARQGAGSKRSLTELQLSGTPLVVRPVRVSSLPEDQQQAYDLTVRVDVREWPIIVIIDHPQIPHLQITPAGLPNDVICISFHDWHELQKRLRSVSATIKYAKNALLENSPLSLGNESERYYRIQGIAHLDSKTPTTSWIGETEDSEEKWGDFFHDIGHKIWPTDGILPWLNASDYRKIVEFFDKVPAELRPMLGKWCAKKILELSTGKEISSGIARIGESRLILAVSEFHNWENEKQFSGYITALTVLRNAQALESGAPTSSSTLGIGILIDNAGAATRTSYAFAFTNQKFNLPAELRANLESEHGVYSHALGATSFP